MTELPSLDTYWVIPDRFLAGAYPGGIDEESTRRKVQSLIHAGIDCVFDLTQPGDAFFTYQKVLNDEAADFDIKIERLNFPIADYDIPTLPYMQKILDTIDQKLNRGQNIYVHCIGGVGRTGTVVGCYLVRHGATGDQALQQIQILRQHSAKWFHRSPEADEQVEFVRKFSNQ